MLINRIQENRLIDHQADVQVFEALLSKQQEPMKELVDFKDCTDCHKNMYSDWKQTYICSSCYSMICRVCKCKVSEFHKDAFNLFGCPSIVMNDMRRFGKVVWIWFYIAFLPLIALRYSALSLVVTLWGFLTKIFGESDQLSILDRFSIGGYLILASITWPMVYVMTVIAGIIY